MTRNYRPTTMRASDADRDAVVSDLSEHFQAGRLTAAELDERTGRALTAGTWGELTELASDLPALRPAAPSATPAAGRPQPPAGHTAPVMAAALAGLAIAAVVLVHAVHGGWGLIWLLWPRAAHRAPRDLLLRHTPRPFGAGLPCRPCPGARQPAVTGHLPVPQLNGNPP